jgi:hypothetical protein
MMSGVVIKDSYKADIFNFDMECWKQEDPKGELFNLTVNNVISWEWMKFKFTKEELKGLANFINSFVDETTDNPVVKRGASQTSCGVE